MNNAQGFLRVIPFLVGIVAGYVASLLLGLVDLAPLAVAPWIGFDGFRLPLVYYDLNRRVIRLAAVFAFFPGFTGKFVALISTIPVPVLGGVSLLLYGYIATNGLRRIQRGRVDLENPKHVIIISAMLVMDLGGDIWGKGMVQVPGMSMAAIFGIALNYFCARS